MTDHDDFDDKPYRPPPPFSDDQVGMVLCFLAFCVLSLVFCFVIWMLPPDSREEFSAGFAAFTLILMFLYFLDRI